MNSTDKVELGWITGSPVAIFSAVLKLWTQMEDELSLKGLPAPGPYGCCVPGTRHP